MVKPGSASFGEISEGVAPLLTAGGFDCQYSFDSAIQNVYGPYDNSRIKWAENPGPVEMYWKQEKQESKSAS